MEVISPVDVSLVAHVVVPLDAKAGFVECMVIPCETASFRELKKRCQSSQNYSQARYQYSQFPPRHSYRGL